MTSDKMGPDPSKIDLKKRLLLMTFFLRYFFVGVEYTVIYTSLLLYMKTLTPEKIYMGLAVALGEVSAMISLPVTGYIYDRTKRPKEILLALNCFQIIGNIVYSLPYSKWLPICGRFIRGFGDGFIILLVSEVTYLYDSSKRIGMLAVLESAQVFGMIAGSIIIVLLENKTLHLGDWILDSYTLPGIIMAIIWLLVQVQTMLCASNITREILTTQGSKGEYASLLTTEDDEDDTKETFENELSTARGESELNSKNLNNDESKIDDPKENSEKQPSVVDPAYKSSIAEIFSREFVVIFAVIFLLLFTKATYELLLPFIAEFEYNWNPKILSVIYIVGGVTVLIIFAGMYLLGERFDNRDSHILIFSLVLTQLNLAGLIFETIGKNYAIRVGLFCLTASLFCISLPFSLVCCKSLLTKLMRPELQGILQGIALGISRVALIGSPLLVSVITEHRMAYGVVASVVCFMTLVGLVYSLERIAIRAKGVTESL